MKRFVLDASVLAKWALPESPQEQDTEQALAIATDYHDGKLRLIEPPHALAEVAAVLARLSPRSCKAKIEAFLNAGLETVEPTVEIWRSACDLAIAVNHHVFDTLYHAVALHTPGSVLITADERYYRKVRGRGRIELLSRYPSVSPHA